MAQIKLAEYTFDNSVGDCLPTLTPNTITMTSEDTVSGTTTRRIVYIDNATMPTQIKFSVREPLLTVDYLNIDSNITSMLQLFHNAQNLTYINVDNWNTSNVTNLNQCFYMTPALTQDIDFTKMNLSKVTGWYQAFAYSSFPRIDLSHISPTLNNNDKELFGYCKAEYINISGWTFTNTMSQLFNNATQLKIVVLNNVTTTGVTDMGTMFRNCYNLKTINVSSFDTSSVTTFANMFNNCGIATEIKGIENFNVSSATNFSSMFYKCSSLTSLDLSSWDTSQCTSMTSMFRDTTSLLNVNVLNFNIDKVTNMDYMFSNCAVKQLDISSFKITDSTTYLAAMFVDSVNLESIDLSNFTRITTLLACLFRKNTNLKTIGMLYSSAESINNLLSVGFQNTTLRDGITIYYHDADASQLTPVEGVTFKKYVMPTTIQLPPHIQLHSLPDGTKDEVDIKTGILTRNVGEIVLDGSEDWKHQQTVSVKKRFYINIDNMVQPQYDNDYGNLLSDYFSLTTATNTWNETVGISSSKSQSIQVYDGKCNSEDEFKVWLSTNNVKVLYQLATPTTEQLILNHNNSCDYGRILPTGMCDKYDVVNSMYTQTMTSILLDGANTWDAMEEFENTVKFTATGTTVGVENLNMLGAGGLYCDNDLFPNINDDSGVPHCRVDEAGNKFYIYVDKEMLMSPDLIGWQIWLQANPFNLIYELAEHLTYTKPYEELDPTQARWEGMDCMRDGAIKYHTNSSDNITMYPTLEYVAPSINNFEVTMLEPNTDYTIYAEGINDNDTINLGGNDINFNNGTVYTSGDNQWLRIDNNDSFYNMVITKGDTTGEVVPYFEGMTSVENPKVIVPIALIKRGEYIVPDSEVKVNVENDGKIYLMGNARSSYTTWDLKTGERIYNNAYNDLRTLQLKPGTYTITSTLDASQATGLSNGYVISLIVYADGKNVHNHMGLYLNNNFERKELKTTVTVENYFNCIYIQRWYTGSCDGIVASIQIEKENTALDSIVSYTDLKLRSLPNGVKDAINVVTGEYVQRVGEREYQDGDLTNENVLTDGINTMYELENYIITRLDPQTLLAYTDGTINLSSDTGLLPTTHYTVPSTNTFHLPSMKTGTRYTLKYPSASGSITIGDITYKISSDSMLFTTPLKINGDTSAIIFSDANPENVILLEGAYNKREVPFFTGVKSVKNPNITIIDQLSTESTTYNCETEIELRGLPNGVADKLDIIKGKLTTNVGIRPYQEGDENLPNIWTDGYETVYALSSPVVINVAIDNPTVTTNSLIELSSDYLIPQLNYRAPSSNNFPLDLLQPNTTYTLYADTLASGSYTLGGTRTGVYSQPHTITLGDMTDNLLTFNGDLGLSNVMLVKGNSLKTTLPPYFLGIRSVTDGHLLVEGMAGEINEITFDEGIVLRDCNGVKDIIDLITCTLTKRTGEITLTGAEGWYRADSESTTDYNVFKLTLGGLKEALVMCDTLQSVFDTKIMDCIHAHTNELCIVIANATIGGNTVNALKSWLNQHPTTVVYQLRVPIEVQLENVWTTTPPTSYSNQTEISSTVSTNSLKPMISVTIATTTLEEIVSNLETQNAQLEEENLATMLALTSVYETMVAPSVATTSVEPEPQATTYSMRRSVRSAEPIGMSVSPMGMVYARLVSKGFKSIDEVPYNLQPEVMYALRGME